MWDKNGKSRTTEKSWWVNLNSFSDGSYSYSNHHRWNAGISKYWLCLITSPALRSRPSNQAESSERRHFRVGSRLMSWIWVGCGKRRWITGGTLACHAADSRRLAHLSASFLPPLFCVVRLPRRNEVVSAAFPLRLRLGLRLIFAADLRHRNAADTPSEV
jgi:hypothetical protein